MFYIKLHQDIVSEGNNANNNLFNAHVVIKKYVGICNITI